ncbi:MAG: tetratricopeptide repeat protein [Bacteriovorax sp.]|nr:tetratricopeptide repeat protein [Bacteriovorax sp.]
MIKTLLFTLFILNSAPAFTEAPKDLAHEAAEKWSKLMNLVNREIQTIKNNKYSGPELKHRLFELYSEKIKLIKEKENLTLLKSDPKSVATNGKDSFFKASREQYMTAQKYAISLINEYPKYERISEIYYALAINSRDYGTSLETEQFLKLSIKTSKENSKTMYNAKTALAEFYYNNKKYNEAISYYQDVLKTNDDEWYGKHLYNASWCYLKERNFKKALELIKASFETTKNKKFVSMREQINNAIGIFYVQGDATREGIDFYEKNTTPSAPWLLIMARSSMNKNNFSLTEEVLRAALKDTLKRKDPKMEMKVRLAQLDIYRESKKEDLYFETANNILDLSKKNKLDLDDMSIAINKIKEVAGFMQINLVKDKTREDVVFNKEDYKKIMRYFDILSSLDKKNKNQYRYYQGETALSTHDYQTALKYYVRSVMNSKMAKDKGEVTRKSLDTMLSTIEMAKLKKTKEDEYTIFAFKNFVLIYPQSDKSQAIYQKLFNKYFELHKIKKAVNILLVYKLNYKEDVKIHREMLTQILDTYIKEKNTDKLAYWVNKIEKGYLSFESEYIQNSIAILGGLLFDKYQAMEKLGKFKEAMKGYESIYDSKQYPTRTKAEAAYAIAALYQEQNHAKDSYKWLKKSLEIYENKDLIKVTPSLLVLAKGYRLLQNFELSSELANQISKRFCDVEYVGKDGFYELLLSNSSIEQALSSKLMQLEDENKKCSLDKRFVEKTQIDNFERLILNDNSKEIIAYFQAHISNDKMARQMGRYLKFKFWQAPVNSKEKLKKEILTLNAVTPALNLEGMFSQYDRVLEFRAKANNLKFAFTTLSKFDDEKYNSEMEQYFSIITELNIEAVALSKDSTPEEVILIREVLSNPYYSLVNSINSFIPQGVDVKYLEGFKQGMRQITESLMAKGLQVDREKMAYLEKNNFFFEVQKYDKFENIKGKNEEQNNLNFHSAILFSNTIDLSRGQRK